MRAIYDFEWLARPDVEGRFFRTEDVLSAYAKQLAPLERRFRIYAALSFLGSSIILAGGIPPDRQIEMFSIQIPSSLITLQLLAVFVSFCFIQSLRGLGCNSVLLGMINKLLEGVPIGSEFVVAKYDASYLWVNVLKRRVVGYESPIYHSAANFLTAFSGWLVLLLHWSIVGAGLWMALEAAWRTAGLSFPFFISLSASASYVAGLLLWLLSFVIPVPYPASKEMRAAWAAAKQSEGIDEALGKPAEQS